VQLARQLGGGWLCDIYKILERLATISKLVVLCCGDDADEERRGRASWIYDLFMQKKKRVEEDSQESKTVVVYVVPRHLARYWRRVNSRTAAAKRKIQCDWELVTERTAP
jgi:hypothetical protein